MNSLRSHPHQLNAAAARAGEKASEGSRAAADGSDAAREAERNADSDFFTRVGERVAPKPLDS